MSAYSLAYGHKILTDKVVLMNLVKFVNLSIHQYLLLYSICMCYVTMYISMHISMYKCEYKYAITCSYVYQSFHLPAQCTIIIKP